METDGIRYSKLSKNIVFSSIWADSPEVCKLCITFLALKDEQQRVLQNLTGIARLCNLSLDVVKAAVVKFESPDPESTSKKEEGRKLLRIDGGWVVVNGEDYDAMGWSDWKREFERKRKAERRARQSRGHTGGNAKAQEESTPDVPRGTPQEEAPQDPAEAPPPNGALAPVVIPKLEEFEEWAMNRRTGHKPHQIHKLYEFLVGNGWRDMKDRPLPHWRRCYWLLTGDEYQRIIGAPEDGIPLSKDGKPQAQIHPSSAGYKAPGEKGF